MKGLFIILFAVCMFAFAKLCCDEKRPNADMTKHDVRNFSEEHRS
jgi:hypothetical protein